MQEDPEYVFKFPEPDPVSPPILGFNDVDFNYPKGPTLFRDLNFGLDMVSRLAIVGPNGELSPTVLKLPQSHIMPVKANASHWCGREVLGAPVFHDSGGGCPAAVVRISPESHMHALVEGADCMWVSVLAAADLACLGC